LIHFAKVFGIVWAIIMLAYVAHILCWFRCRDPLAWPMATIEEYDDRSVLGMACRFGFGDCGFLGIDCGGGYLVPF
jgi:hypothetical protein